MDETQPPSPWINFGVCILSLVTFALTVQQCATPTPIKAQKNYLGEYEHSRYGTKWTPCKFAAYKSPEERACSKAGWVRDPQASGVE